MFWRCHKNLVKKNVKYKNKHAGETCFIFANGGSLKYYDISRLPKYPIIGCTHTLIDNRAKDLNVKYIALTDSYILYPVVFNTYPFIRKFQKNKIRNIIDIGIKNNSKVEYFVNLTNFYSRVCRSKNINYYYHFGDKKSGSVDLSSNFSTMDGALDIMIGMAKFLGFKKAILIGCDYLGSPPVMGHFYADSKPFSGNYMKDYCARIKAISSGIDLLVILPKGVFSPDFPFDSYENYFGLERSYLENSEFIDLEVLAELRVAAASWQAVMSEG
jgi:hypothetical protein